MNIEPAKEYAKVSTAALKNIQALTALQSTIMQLVNSVGHHYKTADNFLEGMDCATITMDSVSIPNTITVDFGSGCASTNGKFTSGSFKVEFIRSTSGEPFLANQGDYFTATFNNFDADSMIADGTMHLENTTPVGADSKTFDFSSNLTTTNQRDLIELTGVNNFNLEVTDDATSNIILLTGTGSGTTVGGINFTQTITNPLLLRTGTGCVDHFSEGVLLIESVGYPDKTIDYGSGACDNQATITENGNSSTIRLD